MYLGAMYEHNFWAFLSPLSKIGNMTFDVVVTCLYYVINQKTLSPLSAYVLRDLPVRTSKVRGRGVSPKWTK